MDVQVKEQRTEERMSPCNVLDYTEELLSRRTKNKFVRIYPQDIPAYKWSGAGSEKGGSSGYLTFDKMIFAPEEHGDYLAISVGRKNGKVNTSGMPAIIHSDNSVSIPYNPKMYGVFRVILPKDIVEKVLEMYEPHKRKKSIPRNISGYWDSPRGKIDRALGKLIGKNNKNYEGISLFAFDGEIRGLRQGFFVKKHIPFDKPLEDVLEEFSFEDGFRFFSPYEKDEGRKLSSKLADKLLVSRNFKIEDRLVNLVPRMSDEDYIKTEENLFSAGFDEDWARRCIEDISMRIEGN